MDLEPTEPFGSPPDRVLIEAQRMDLVGRLAPGISHELANPFQPQGLRILQREGYRHRPA